MIDLASIETIDLSTDRGVAVARNRLLRKAWSENDRAAADSILTSILHAQPERLKEHVERLDNAMNMEESSKGEKYLDEINACFPELMTGISARDGMILLRSVLRLGHMERAVKLADELRIVEGGDAKLSFMLLRVYEKAGRVDRIMEIADDVYSVSTERLDIRAKLISLLVDIGQTGKALSLVGGGVELNDETIDLVLQVSRAHLRANQTDPRGLEMLEDVFTFSPDRDDVKLALTKAYLQFGRAKQALEVLDIDPGHPVTGRESYRQIVADTFMANDLFGEAGAIYRELSRENPLHSGWRRSGIGALLQAGEHSKANALYEEDRMQRRLSVHDTFDSRLRALDDELHKAPIPAVRFDWAYRKLEQLNAAPADREAWERASRRVYLADLLTIDWLETRTDDADQLLKKIRDPEKALAPLVECLESGDGAFIASLHMGSMFSGPALMAGHGIDFRWLASTPAIAALPGADQLLSTTSMSSVAVARSVFRAIRGGSAVTIAIDGGAPSVSRPVSFLGDEILLTDMVPRTVFKTGARSFYPKVIWVGDEISLEFIELIPPAADDTLESFTSVWFRDFMECVADMCVEAPDNFRLAGGFWTNLSL
jgi:hypothetical protein